MTTEQIHADFKNALNLSTLQFNEVDTTPADTFNKLRSIGANSCSNMAAVINKREQTTLLQQENEDIALLRTYEAKYPKYRIIDYQSVIKFCEKYNLVIGCLSNYKEVIPSVNLEEIVQYTKEANIATHRDSIIWKLYDNKSDFLIVAPFQFFAKGRLIGKFVVDLPKPVWDLRIHVPSPDPIVLHELPMNGKKKYFHIVSAWDIEADDAMVTKKLKVYSSSN